MNYLTTGEMAKYCQVTKRTLWLYHEKGLLSPKYIDKDTGYYYYDSQQRWQLDTILHLKSIGLTLGQIKELLQASEPDQLAALFQEHIHNLEEELQQIQTSLFSAHLMLGPVSFLKQDPNADKVKLEYMPHCKYLRLNATCNTEYSYFNPDDCWTDQLHSMRLYLEKEEIPLSAHYVGHVYRETAPGCHDLVCSDITTYVDESLTMGNSAHMPDGHYMTYVYSDFANKSDGKRREEAYRKIVDEIHKRNYKICGDAFDEALLVNDDYTMSVRMMVPVKVPRGTYLGV